LNICGEIEKVKSHHRCSGSRTYQRRTNHCRYNHRYFNLAGKKPFTFSGKYARSIGQPVLYVTERAVFKLVPEGMLLIEIAPGMELQRDILDQMAFQPLISPDLKPMPEGTFHEKWGELKLIIESHYRDLLN
jgi:hypothetical protein